MMTMRHTSPSCPPPGLAFGEPDDRLRRASSTPRPFGSITGASEYWIVGRSLSSGAHSRDPVADDDIESLAPRPAPSLRALAKQSRGRKEALDCFVARAPRNDVERSRYNSAFSRQHPPEFCKFIGPQKERAQCDPQERAQGRPGARCTRGPVCKSSKQKRTRAYRFSGSSPAFPAQWFYGSFSCSPRRDHSLFVTVVPRKRELPENLTPAIGASGPHDFAVRVSRARQSQPSRPPLPAPTSVTMANAPSLGTGWQGISR
jgi:hypothetical protein